MTRNQVKAVADEGCAITNSFDDTIALRRSATELVSWKDPMSEDNPAMRAWVKILGFNDFHGRLSTDKRIEGRPAGGAAVLAAYLQAAMDGAQEHTVIVHSGDLVGASPPASALHQDEPAMDLLNLLANRSCHQPEKKPSKCNIVTALGNHELDEGVDEMKRLLYGGDFGGEPVRGKSYTGARFPMLSANVVNARTGETILPPYAIREINGTRIGFIGATLKDAEKFLILSGISSIRFEEVVPAVQAAVDALKQKGVHAIVLMLHEGGYQQRDRSSPRDAPLLKGSVADIVGALDKEVDLVISGHSHSPINILLPNAGGRPTLVTQAFCFGTAFADIDLEIDKKTGEVVEKSARIVTTWADEGPGLKPDPEIVAMVERAEADVREKTEQVVTETADEFPRQPSCDGESAIGSLIADAQRWALGADIAFIHPTWIRAGLNKGPVTWGELFAVQPFGNRVLCLEMTGQQIMDLLNQQWIDDTHSRVLNVSGLTFTWAPSRPVRNRVVEVLVARRPMEMSARYTVAVNEFLAQGGEMFSVFTNAKRLKEETLDIDALVKYIGTLRKPIHPKIEGRIRRVRPATTLSQLSL